MEPLSVQVQTVFAELAERVAAREAARSISSLSGFFTQKTVRDGHYWYFKTSLPGRGQHEYYLGAETPALRRLIDAYREGRPGEELEEGEIARLCAMLRAAGANTVDSAASRILKALADSGLFRLGGVLVGTYAFLAIGNILGIRWGAVPRTEDIDIAAGTALSIGLPYLDANIPSVFEGLAMGFLPVPEPDSRQPSTSYKVRGKSLRVDFLTPAVAKRRSKPIPIQRLGISAAPLEMLDYLIEAPVATVAVDGGATQVNVPDAARFALHKLALAERRPLAQQSKAVKDREQGILLLTHLHRERAGDVDAALARAFERFPMVFNCVVKAARRLPESELRSRILYLHSNRKTTNR
jgi:hypothetical protein